MEAPLIHLALVGTPNSGKTSLFNALTGSRQKVANYPGVTVERKEGSFVTPAGRQVSVVDLPGTYSLRGRSPDEEITRDMVLGRTPGETLPDLVLCVADSTNLRLDHPPAARAQAHRPAADAGAQHVRHRDAAAASASTCPALRSARRSGRDIDRGAQGRHRRIAAPDRRVRGAGVDAICGKSLAAPHRLRAAGRPSARPTASSLPPSACRQGPTPGRRGSTPWCCIRWRGWRSWP